MNELVEEMNGVHQVKNSATKIEMTMCMAQCEVSGWMAQNAYVKAKYLISGKEFSFFLLGTGSH